MQDETTQQDGVQQVEGHHYWFPQDQLGVLESEVLNLCFLVGQTKKQNRSRFNNLVRALKLLKLIPAGDEVLEMGQACNSAGERGLFVGCRRTVKVLAQVPTQGAYAQERRNDRPDGIVHSHKNSEGI